MTIDKIIVLAIVIGVELHLVINTLLLKEEDEEVRRLMKKYRREKNH